MPTEANTVLSEITVIEARADDLSEKYDEERKRYYRERFCDHCQVAHRYYTRFKGADPS